MCLASLGDVTGDGVPEFIVSAPREVSAKLGIVGRVYVFDGSDASTLFEFEGDITKDRFGWSVGTAGDVDGDGVNDIIVGSPWDDTFTFEHGSVDVYSGADGALIHHVDGDTTFGWFGADVASAGDLNGDGRDEFMVGAPRRWYGGGAVSAGEVWVLDGLTGALIALLPDVDGDGFPEHIIGQPRFMNGALETGRVAVYSGADGGLISSSLGIEHSRHGTSVAAMYDFNGDGQADVLAGACFCQNTGPSWSGDGYASVIDAVTGNVLGQASGASGSAFSFNVAGLDDINGDGVPDFAVGNHWDFATGPKQGSGFVFSGKDLSLSIDEHQVSRSAGGTQQLSIDVSAEFGGAIYAVIGSVSGYAPGFLIDQIRVPINFDWYTSLSLQEANNLWFVNSIDFLDANGDASASLSFVPGMLPMSATGMLFDHTAVIVQGSTVVAATNHVPLTVIP